MTELNCACDAPLPRLLSAADAVARIDSLPLAVPQTEMVKLTAARGRILAHDVVSAVDIPAFANSAMDGYACWAADLMEGAPTVLRVVGEAAAGHAFTGKVAMGEAVRIFTGAPVPLGLDAVVMQEDCARDGETVTIAAGAGHRHIRAAGEDVATGAVVLIAGRRLRPAEIAMAAALGLAELPVARRPRIAVFSTGDELCEPGTELRPGCIYDSNRHAVLSLVDALGAEACDCGILADDPAVLRAGLAAAAAACDMIVTSGGVSVGDHDHVTEAVRQLGKLDFWKLAIKPGKPLAIGEIDGKPFVGLPGNPVSAMVTFALFARRIALRLMGVVGSGHPAYALPLDFAFKRKPGRREWLRVRRVRGEDGNLRLELAGGAGSHLLSSLTNADGLVEIPEVMAAIKPGDVLDYLPFTDLEV